MKKQLLVSVSGMEGMGVSVACERVAHSLNKSGINTVVVDLGTPKRTEVWEDNYLIGLYKRFDVIILKRHGYTHTAVKLRLSPFTCRFKQDSVRPDIAVLLTCDNDTYGKRNNINVRNVMHDKTVAQFERLKRYSSLEWCHWGTKNIVKLNTDGPLGRLYAAGNLKRLILKELADAKNIVA